MAKSKKTRSEPPSVIDPNSRATVPGPAEPKPLVDSPDDLTAKVGGTQQLSAAQPFNPNKPLEYDPEVDGGVLEFIKDQYRHCKPILAIGSATDLLQKADIPETLVSGHADPGLLLMEGDDPAGVASFIAAIAKHRHFQRETDPPRV